MDKERSKVFEELVEEHIGVFKGYAIKLEGSEEKGEDLIQEALLKVWDNFDNFEIGTNFRAWVMRIIKNEFINRYRKNKIHRKRKSERTHDIKAKNIGEDPVRQDRMIELKGGLDEVDPKIISALNELRDEFRDVLLLRADGCSYKEISKKTNCPIGTVMSRLYRARKEVKQLIDREDFKCLAA